MQDLFVFILVGFIAQMVNGSLGMAYGMITMTFLLTIGTPPLLANSSVQFAKILTSGTSSISHWRFGNVDSDMLFRLGAAGMIGGIVGALIATSLPNTILTPFVAIYLFAMGMRIFLRSSQQVKPSTTNHSYVAPLGAIGGFLNALGGAGWGPVTTSTLLARGENPRLAIGTVSVAEFFVTVATFIILITHIQISNLRVEIIAGLMIGGMCASPFAAYLCGRLPTRTVMSLVSILIMVLSVSIFLSGV
ncbi:MAG: sulfite exporter TauE/SafE family protein [Aggregatilineales bacterium]